MIQTNREFSEFAQNVCAPFVDEVPMATRGLIVSFIENGGVEEFRTYAQNIYEFMPPRNF